MNPKYRDIGDPAINLIEEASELIKAVTKLERFGAYNWNPLLPNKITNLEQLRSEWSDLKTRYDEYISYVIARSKDETT